ncbi:Ig-like domain-containing protein, partial [Candidatus Pacearchaeota archaeon]|nr:Ig-like domain-containing protein [Candidatus Pacearchaeota archaeon]
MKHRFKKLFKKFIKITHSNRVRFGGLGVVSLAILLFGYSSISLPAIEDGYFPDEVRKVSFNAPLTLHFNHPMSQSSVEDHFSIQPPLAGQFNWVDSKTLEYTPDEPLEIDDDYVISIASNAKSLYGKSIGVDYRLRFLVSGPPRIKFISPYLDPYQPEEVDVDEAIDDESGFVEGVGAPTSDILIIPSDQAVTVMFDRPIRALTTIDNIGFNEEFPELQIDPPVKGSYRWIGTTAFQFTPEKWTMGTTYTLKLPSGIPALDGGVTDEERVWRLATESPKVQQTTPFQSDDVVLVDQAITLRFNQVMDLDFVRPGDNVLLYPSNDKDADQNAREDGFFNTEVVYGKNPEGKVDRSYLVFKPEFPYQYDQEYRLVVKASLPGGAHQLEGGYGDRFMEEDFELKFKTISKPGIVSSLPKTGEKNYEDRFVEITFASPVTSEMVAEHITMEPAIEAEPRISMMKQGRVARIHYNLEPSTYYNFRFRGPFEDAVGNEGEGGVYISFKTTPLKPYMRLLSSGSFGMFTEGLDPVYPIKTVNVNELKMSLCRISEKEFFSVSKHYNWYTYRCPNPMRKTIELNTTLNKTHLRDLNLPQLFDTEFEPGIYFFEFNSDDYPDYNKKPRRFYQTFFISKTHLTLKKSDQDLLVWATDLKTGEPVSRMELSIRSNGGEELQRGVTDGNGLYKITKHFEDPVYVVGTKKIGGENRWSLVGANWANGIESWRFGLRGEWVDYDEPRAYLYTDRPLYKPG